MKKKTHIIEKVIVDVNTTEVVTANYVKNNLGMFLNKELFPKLEKLFQKYDRPDTIVRFHDLHINVHVKDWENPGQVKFEILFEIEEQLRKQLLKVDPISITADVVSVQSGDQLQNLSMDKNEEEIFLFFLENGFLPWYGNKEQINTIQHKENWQSAFSKESLVQRLTILFQKDEITFVRFFYQFPIEMVMAFISKINVRLAEVKTNMIETLEHLPPNLELELLYTLFMVSVEKRNEKIILLIQRWLRLLQQNKKNLTRIDEGSLSEIGILILRATPVVVLSDDKFQKILNESLVLISKDKFPKDTFIPVFEDELKWETPLSKRLRLKKDKEGEHNFFENSIPEIAVQNAGLVILYPFLKHFFMVLKITNNRGIIISSERERAVQILCFLATGSEEFFEGNLILEKFLCGMPLGMPVSKRSKLTPAIKDEAQTMLLEIIKNWPALKNTSPDGLRQMFLKREGKLIQNNKNFKLIIERKAQDVLLENLAWNISVIKLQWLSEMLFVDW